MMKLLIAPAMALIAFSATAQTQATEKDSYKKIERKTTYTCPTLDEVKVAITDDAKLSLEESPWISLSTPLTPSKKLFTGNPNIILTYVTNAPKGPFVAIKCKYPIIEGLVAFAPELSMYPDVDPSGSNKYECEIKGKGGDGTVVTCKDKDKVVYQCSVLNNSSVKCVDDREN